MGASLSARQATGRRPSRAWCVSSPGTEGMTAIFHCRGLSSEGGWPGRARVQPALGLDAAALVSHLPPGGRWKGLGEGPSMGSRPTGEGA